MTQSFEQVRRSNTPISSQTCSYQELACITQCSPYSYRIAQGFVPNMHVPGMVYVSPHLKSLLDAELQQYHDAAQLGGFVPAVRQIANVASLPGIVKASIALPDVHSGYGFAIGNVAAFDMDNPDAVVSPGGVGFDINCGVRLLRTNLVRVEARSGAVTTSPQTIDDVEPLKEQLAQQLFNNVPVGVGGHSLMPTAPEDLNEILEMGMDWSVREVG